MRDAATVVMFGAVFAASVMNQLPIRPWHSLVARFDPWTFLPHWGFFGPNPAFAGLHLVYRDESPAGRTKWVEIDIPHPTGWYWFWNPARHERKALHDLLNGLAKIATDLRDESKMMLSTCHLALATWVMNQAPDDPEATSRQFALVEAVGHGADRRLRPVFISRRLAFG